VLLLYEGDAASQAEAKVRVRMVDFAHTFQQQEGAAGDSGPGASAGGGSGQQQQQGAGSPCCGNGSSGAGGEAQGQVAAAGASRDDNFHAGLRALLARLRSVVHAQLEQDLTA
jgi:hypothetical protein